MAAGGVLYFSGESGAIVVVKPGTTFEVLATNDMGETCMATPAVSDGRLFIRTRHHVVAIQVSCDFAIDLLLGHFSVTNEVPRPRRNEPGRDHSVDRLRPQDVPR